MRMRHLISAAAVAAGLSVSPVGAQTSPSERNIAVWPLPETLSPLPPESTVVGA